MLNNIENSFPKPLFSNVNLSNIKLVNDFVKNKNLVNILNHKIFKGYNKIKILSNPNFNIENYMKFFNSKKKYPFYDNFNIYYETKFLGKNLKQINDDNNALILNLKHLSYNNLKNVNINNNNEINNLKIKKSNSSSNYYEINNNSVNNIKKINYNIKEDFRKIFVNNYNNNRNKFNNNLKNINSKIFLNTRENKCFSKYSYVMIDKLNNEYNYNSNSLNKNNKKQQLNQKILNKDQSDFLYNLSYIKSKEDEKKNILAQNLNFIKNKNIYRAQDLFKLRKNNIYNKNYSYDNYISPPDIDPMTKLKIKKKEEKNKVKKNNTEKNLNNNRKEINKKNNNDNFNKEILNNNNENIEDNNYSEKKNKKCLTSYQKFYERNIDLINNYETIFNKEMEYKNKKFLLLKNYIENNINNLHELNIIKNNENNKGFQINSKNNINNKLKIKNFLVKNNSNLLKKYEHNNLNAYKKIDKFNDRKLWTTLSKSFSTEEINKIGLNFLKNKQ